MSRALVIRLGFAVTLLGSCSGVPPTARIVAFTASAQRIPRNAQITLHWEAEGAGVQGSLPSCILTRRFGNETSETTVRSACTGSLAEVPPAPLAATAVEYRFAALKQPFDASDPYLSEVRSIALDPAMYATNAGGTSTDRASGVSALGDGSAIVTGYFSDTATFGATTLASVGGIDAFVARIQPGGAWAWATSAGGTDTDLAYGVSTLADGSAIVAGRFTAAAAFGTRTLTSAGVEDVFVARVHPDGTWAWATRGGGTSFDGAQGVSALPDGGAIVAGSFVGTATFGTTTVVSAGLDDVFVARIRPDGVWAWANRGGGADFGRAEAVSTLPDGGAIVAGSFVGTFTFGTTTLTSTGTEDAFVARIHPDGRWAWATSAGGVSDDDGVEAVSTLTNGTAVVAGTFVGTVAFGLTTLTSLGVDAFVARIEPDGTWAWAEQAGGTDVVLARGVSALADGGALVAGTFFGAATFGPTTLTNTGFGDAFVARIGADGAW